MTSLTPAPGFEGHLVCYSHPARTRLCIVDVSTGRVEPLRSPADHVDDAVDRLERIGRWFVFHQSVGVVAFRADQRGGWLVFDGAWGPISSHHPDRFWVTLDSPDVAVQVDGDGEMHALVDLTGIGHPMLRAELDGSLLVEDHSGSLTAVAIQGGSRRRWPDMQIIDRIGEELVAVSADGRGLVSCSFTGAEVRRAQLAEGWRWTRSGSLSPDGRFYVDVTLEAVPFAEIKLGRWPARQRVVASLDDGAIVPLEPADAELGYLVWNDTSDSVLATESSRRLVTVSPLNGVVTPVSQRFEQGPLAVVSSAEADVLRRAPSSWTRLRLNSAHTGFDRRQ